MGFEVVCEGSIDKNFEDLFHGLDLHVTVKCKESDPSKTRILLDISRSLCFRGSIIVKVDLQCMADFDGTVYSQEVYEMGYYV
jgi:hypothetical protein